MALVSLQGCRAQYWVGQCREELFRLEDCLLVDCHSLVVAWLCFTQVFSHYPSYRDSGNEGIDCRRFRINPSLKTFCYGSRFSDSVLMTGK